VNSSGDLLVIRNVRAIDPAVGLDGPVDVVVEKGIIVRIGSGAGKEAIASEHARSLDGGGRWLLPAFVDLHAHLREPGHEYKEDITTGLRAAAAGGYAHVCVMPNTKPVNDTRAVTDFMLRRAGEVGASVLHPIGAITVGQRGAELTEMGELREAGAVAVSDDGVCVMSANVMRRALEYARVFDMPVIQHCEDHNLTAQADMNEGPHATRLGLRGWPRVAEDVILARDVLLAEFTKSKYHAAHLSTLGAVRIMREAKSRGLPVTCEVTPHHLLLTDAAVIGYDTACKVNPPLREPEDLEALRKALADGTIDAIATDHAPHAALEKDCEFQDAKPGIMGLELCFGLLLSLVRDKTVSLARLTDALSTRPAKIAGIEPPALKAGLKANMVLVDPEQKWVPQRTELASKSRNTPFLATEISGRVLLTLAEGRVVYDGLPKDGDHG
jgi:dihydroorotase